MGCGSSRDINDGWNRPRRSDKKDKSPRLVHFAEGTKGGPSKPRLSRAQTGLSLGEMAELDDQEQEDEGETLEFDLPGTAGGSGTPHPAARVEAADAVAGTPP